MPASLGWLLVMDAIESTPAHHVSGDALWRARLALTLAMTVLTSLQLPPEVLGGGGVVGGVVGGGGGAGVRCNVPVTAPGNGRRLAAMDLRKQPLGHEA